jgi:hypothetical protein
MAFSSNAAAVNHAMRSTQGEILCSLARANRGELTDRPQTHRID